MKPVTVAIDVPDPGEDVYNFLAATAAHESFTDHMLQDWTCSGPDRGVGSKAHVTSVLGGRREPIDIEVVEDLPPRRIVERNVSAGGRRVATGTYELAPIPGGTRVTFTYAWADAPLGDRMLAPVVRRLMRRNLQLAMRRLAAELDRRRTEPSAAGHA
ncbi:SRPBCC family protein [Planosporangium thailandense]|uniref:SRPBCC family protein n=1 Tax=Planosporangium thailandense TaxID=765197 RepID=A0ABX0Y6I6_9ACTN|nr:SRPBCC family protein [Planosporangium thailandense]NJC73638.1 SRPBCC family protein [Planosporangium thailandense]